MFHISSQLLVLAVLLAIPQAVIDLLNVIGPFIAGAIAAGTFQYVKKGKTALGGWLDGRGVLLQRVLVAVYSTLATWVTVNLPQLAALLPTGWDGVSLEWWKALIGFGFSQLVYFVGKKWAQSSAT